MKKIIFAILLGILFFLFVLNLLIKKIFSKNKTDTKMSYKSKTLSLSNKENSEIYEYIAKRSAVDPNWSRLDNPIFKKILNDSDDSNEKKEELIKIFIYNPEADKRPATEYDQYLVEVKTIVCGNDYALIVRARAEYDLYTSIDLAIKVFNNFITYYAFRKEIADAVKNSRGNKDMAYAIMNNLPGFYHIGANEMLEHGEYDLLQFMGEKLMINYIETLINLYEKAKEKNILLWFIQKVSQEGNQCTAGIMKGLADIGELLELEDPIIDLPLTDYQTYYDGQGIHGIIETGFYRQKFKALLKRKLHSHLLNELSDKYQKLKDGAIYRQAPDAPKEYYNKYFFSFVKEQLPKILTQLQINRFVSDEEIKKILKEIDINPGEDDYKELFE